LASVVTGSDASTRITARAPAAIAAAAALGSSVPKNTTVAPGATANTRRANSALSGLDNAGSASTRSTGCSLSRASASTIVTAVRTACATPSLAAAAATVWAATCVRTHTKTVRTVGLLSPEEKTTKWRDQNVVLPELTYKKLTDDMPSLAAASRVIQKLWQRRESVHAHRFLPAARMEGART
jgi:hypothetical protein